MKAEKLYQCEFCGKGGFNRKKMRHHEENCPLISKIGLVMNLPKPNASMLLLNLMTRPGQN